MEYGAEACNSWIKKIHELVFVDNKQIMALYILSWIKGSLDDYTLIHYLFVGELYFIHLS